MSDQAMEGTTRPLTVGDVWEMQKRTDTKINLIYLRTQEKISASETESLMKMIQSLDSENYYVAKKTIDNLMK